MLISKCRRVARIWKRGGGLFWKTEKCANDLDPNFHCSWISFTRFARKLRRNFSESSEIQTFFRPKSGGLQRTKKKVFTDFGTDFLAEIGNSNVFFAQNQVVSKEQKKGSSPILRLIFRPKSEIQTFFSPKIRWSPKNKKKGSSPILGLIFWPKSEIQTFFSTKIRWSPKNKKKRSSPILRLIFRPKSNIQTFEGGLFSYGVGYFQFFTKNLPQNHQKGAILHTSQANGRLKPLRPPLATLLSKWII